MKAGAEYRDRDETEVAVLEALLDRGEEGMTVLELRTRTDSDIDDIEAALGALKEDGLIDATTENGRTVIRADDAVVPDGDPEMTWTARERAELFARKLWRALRGILFP
jgi:hypothetical protein